MDFAPDEPEIDLADEEDGIKPHVRALMAR